MRELARRLGRGSLDHEHHPEALEAEKAHDSQLIGIRAALRGGRAGSRSPRPSASPGLREGSFNEAIAERLDADAAAAARDLAGARPVR